MTPRNDANKEEGFIDDFMLPYEITRSVRGPESVAGCHFAVQTHSENELSCNPISPGRLLDGGSLRKQAQVIEIYLRILSRVAELSRWKYRIGIKGSGHSLEDWMRKRLSLLLLAGLSFGFARFAVASIVYDVPNGLIAQPNNDPRWNSTVQWSDGGGTIIAGSYFITAQHLTNNANVGSTVKLTTKDGLGISQNFTFTAASVQQIGSTDLRVVKINGTFPSSASIIPLYSGPAGSEVGKPVSFLGYGNFQQGAAVITGSTQNGWLWAGPTGVKNFGQNTIGSVDTGANGGPGGSSLLDYEFNAIPGQKEAVYANRDSGGGTFINNGGVYQLAGVNYSIDQFFSKSGSTFTPINGAIYDSTGLYVDISMTMTPNYVLASSQGIADQHGYSSEIAPFYNTIRADIPEPASLVLCGLSTVGFIIFRCPRRDD